MAYTVRNRTDRTIWWKDGLWTSGELAPGDEKTVRHEPRRQRHRLPGQGYDNEPLGAAWFPQFGSVDVYGKWHWDIRPLEVRMKPSRPRLPL